MQILDIFTVFLEKEEEDCTSKKSKMKTEIGYKGMKILVKMPYMAPKKRARTGQGANAALGVAADPLLGEAGEYPRGENNPPTATLPNSATLQQGDSSGSRVNRFLQLDPTVFTGSNPEEGLQGFIDEMHNTLRIIRATETKGVELAAYCLKEVAYSWFEMLEDSREEGSPPVRWSEFSDACIDHFLPAETRASRAAKFENLKQGSRSVWEYHMEFARVSKYVIHMLPTMEARMRRFVQGLSLLVINEAAIAALNSDMNYGKMIVFAQATKDCKLNNRKEREGTSKARSAGNFGESLGGGRSAFRGGSSGPTQYHAQSSASAPPAGHSQQQGSHFMPNQGSWGPRHQGRSGGRFQQQRRPPCPKCGNMHLGISYMDLPICYRCGLRDHIQREWCSSRQGAGRGIAQPSNSVVATSSAPPPARGPPAPAGRGAARGGA
ncbi:uncharacterized protein [Nicotiana tomentosiformis]|uniref:uncharacterized protein n=1 Tax=Nicotiana tomentosiformis TaxID=4098 RepID=UPI00388C3BC3